MPDNTNPGFNDVLNIGVNPEGFEQGLNQLAEIYNNWAEKLSGKGIDANKVLNVDASTGSLEKLSNQIENVRQYIVSFQEAFDTSMNKTATTAEATSVKVSQAMRDVMKGITGSTLLKEAVQEYVDGQADIVKAAADTNNRLREINLARAEEARKLAASVARDNGITNPEQLKVLEEMIAKELAAISKEADSMINEYERANNARIKDEERTAQQIQKIREQSAKALAQYADERNRKGFDFGTNPADDPRKGEEGFLNNLVGRFTIGNIGSQIAQLAAYQAEWALIQGTISAIEAPAKAFFETVRGGVEYLQSFEERSSILQGVLLQTVTYSKDFTTNLKASADEANRLTANIDTMSAKLNISQQTLQTGFTTFLEAGGRNLVSSSDDALRVSGLIAASLQSQRQPVDSRTIRTTTQNLVQGDPAANDKFALFLGVSTDKLKEMVAHAKDFKDLYSQIIAAAPGLNERLATAGERQDALLASLKLYAERFEGLIAGPLFKQFTEFLQGISTYLSDNEDKFRVIGEELGGLVGKAGEFVKTFLTANWPSLVSVFQTIGHIAIDIGASVAQIVNNIGLAVQLASKFKATVPTDAEVKAQGFSSVNTQEAAAFGVDLNKLRQQAAADKANREQFTNRSFVDIFADSQRNAERISSGANQANSILDRIVTGQIQGSPSTRTEIPGVARNGIVTKTKATNSREDLDGYREQIAKVKSDTDELLNKQRELKAEGETNLASMTAESVGYLQMEIDAVKKLTDAYSAKALASGAKNAKDEANRIREDGQKTINALNNQIASLTRTNSQDITNARDITNRGNQQVDIQNTQNQIAARRAEGASELELAERTAELHREEFRINQENLRNQLALTTTESDRARVQAQINLDASKQTSVASNDDVAIKQAAINEQVRIYSEGIAKNNELLKEATAQYEIQNEYQNNAYLRQQAKIALDELSIQNAKNNIALLTAEAGALEAMGGRANQDRASAVRKQISDAKGTLAGAQRQLAKDDPTLLQLVFGDGQLDSLADVFDKGFANGVTDLLGAFASADRIFKDFENGQKQGGVLGGIGSVLQGSGGRLATTGIDALNNTAASGTGLFSSVLSAAGPFISAIGPAFSLIGSLFTQAAKETADEMKKQFNQIQENYKAGSINLSQAITQEQNTINETISKLSGQKGGKSELDAILPGMQSSLDALKQQQKDIFVNMDNNVASLKVQQTYLQSALSTWNDINKQVTEYINAGGSVATAQEFLSLSLQKQKQQAADDLQEAEASAIKDAQNYNDLIKQRTDLIKNYNQQAFGLKNADSIERQQAGAVSRASQLDQITQDYQASLLNLNQQVTQAQQRVDLEKQIFGIQTDSASLAKAANDSALYSLQEQVKQWQAIQDIYNGIVQKSDGTYSYTDALGSLLGFTAGFGNSTSSSYTGATTPITGYTSGVDGGSTVSSIRQGTTTPVLNSIGSNNNPVRPVVFSGAVTITLPNTGDVNATTFAQQLYDELINRNQYAGSSYYG